MPFGLTSFIARRETLEAIWERLLVFALSLFMPSSPTVSGYAQSELDQVALRSSQRLSKTLGFRLPHVYFEPEQSSRRTT